MRLAEKIEGEHPDARFLRRIRRNSLDFVQVGLIGKEDRPRWYQLALVVVLEQVLPIAEEEVVD
jgi:hypothetical protein